MAVYLLVFYRLSARHVDQHCYLMLRLRMYMSTTLADPSKCADTHLMVLTVLCD